MPDRENILNLIIPEDLRDDLIDILICRQNISGFSLYAVDGFSREHSRFDLTEQTQGYRKLYRLELLHNHEQLQDILATLQPLYLSTPLRYWITPVLQSGHLG